MAAGSRRVAGPDHRVNTPWRKVTTPLYKVAAACPGLSGAMSRSRAAGAQSRIAATQSGVGCSHSHRETPQSRGATAQGAASRLADDAAGLRGGCLTGHRDDAMLQSGRVRSASDGGTMQVASAADTCDGTGERGHYGVRRVQMTKTPQVELRPLYSDGVSDGPA